MHVHTQYTHKIIQKDHMNTLYLDFALRFSFDAAILNKSVAYDGGLLRFSADS